MDESKRRFLKRSVGLLAAGGLVTGGAKRTEAVEPPDVAPSMKAPGAGMSEYGTPAKYEGKVTRTLIRSQPGTTGSGASRTPLESLDGMITPSGLHFERHHSGVPDIDPARHRLLIHGLVKRPLIFSMDALIRYPMISRIHFMECAGNSQLLYQPTPPNLTVGQAHGLVSCSEWTGVPLRILLEEAGVDRSAQWLLAEGADAAGHEPEHPDGQGDGRCDPRAVPERRAAAPGERLSGAAVPPRLGRQHEREVAAAPQGRAGRS
jgi:sulfane dehydrogenase subunit SoxC